jgi:hypothetical protein
LVLNITSFIQWYNLYKDSPKTLDSIVCELYDVILPSTIKAYAEHFSLKSKNKYRIKLFL